MVSIPAMECESLTLIRSQSRRTELTTGPQLSHSIGGIEIIRPQTRSSNYKVSVMRGLDAMSFLLNSFIWIASSSTNSPNTRGSMLEHKMWSNFQSPTWPFSIVRNNMNIWRFMVWLTCKWGVMLSKLMTSFFCLLAWPLSSMFLIEGLTIRKRW